MDQSSVVAAGAGRQPGHQLVPAGGGVQLVGHQAVLDDGCAHRFQVVESQLWEAVLRRQHFSLLGDFDAALQGPAWLGEDRLIGRATASADRSTATVEQP